MRETKDGDKHVDTLGLRFGDAGSIPATSTILLRPSMRKTEVGLRRNKFCFPDEAGCLCEAIPEFSDLNGEAGQKSRYVYSLHSR